MRIFALLLALCLALAAPAMAEVKKAKTIDELAKMYDSTQCKSCHQEIYDQWAKSHHARSLMGVKDGLMMTPLAMKGGTAFSPDEPSKATIKTFPCFKCHLPQALRFAEDSVAAEYAQALVDGKKEIVAKLNIGCMVCHNEKAIIHKNQEGMPVAGTVYGKADNPAHAGGPMKKSSIMTHAIMCGQCHGLGPNLEFDNPVQCATLYGSYEHAYIPNGGTQQCQECHMPMVNGKADHLIAPNFNDHIVSKAMLDQALDFNMEAFAYEWLRKAKDARPMIVVNTRIDNRAGHRVPDGWPSHNRVVLEVTATAADGKEIGKIEKHYHPQATTCRDQKMMYGAQWKAQYIRDTSIQPFAPKTESLEIPLPEGVRKASVTAALYYEINAPDNKIEIFKVTKDVSLDR